MKKKPKVIAFVPRWQGVEGLAVVIIRRHFGMLSAEHEFEDLLQEAWIVFSKVRTRYPNIDNQTWFTVVFGNSLRNRLLNMAAKCGRVLSLDAMAVPPEPAAEGDAFDRLLMKKLPHKVRWLINQVCFGPGAQGREAYRKLQEYFPALT